MAIKKSRKSIKKSRKSIKKSRKSIKKSRKSIKKSIRKKIDGTLLNISFTTNFDVKINIDTKTDYCVEKTLKCKKDGEEGKIYFVFQKLTKDNIIYWRNYLNFQYTFTKRVGVNDKITIIDGLGAFDQTLDLFKNKEVKDCDIYIAFAVRNIKDIQPKFDIEMCFTVFMQKDIPITTHIGIFKNFISFPFGLTDERIHFLSYQGLNKDKLTEIKKRCEFKNLSIYLHAYACMVELEINKELLYMMTKPATKMTFILYENIPKKYISIGSMKERIIIQNKDEIIAELEAIKEADYNKTKVIEFLNKYHTYTRNLYNGKKASEFLNVIKSTENNLTEDEKKYIDRIYESFYIDIERYDEWNDDYIPYFFPGLKSTKKIPINDINDEEWSVDVEEEEKKIFKKPEWFIHHQDLNIGYLRNVTISIPGASALMRDDAAEDDTSLALF